MRGWQRRMRHLEIALVLLGCLTTGARADALYSVTSLGPADSSGNYLNALSAADQAAFRAGSFDVFAHPATVSNLPDFWISTGGAADLVRTDLWNDQIFINSTGMVTNNNLGQEAGSVLETFQWTPGGATTVAIFTPNPHTLTDPTNGTLTITSPGYLQSLNLNPWTDSPSFPLNGGKFIGSINGLNDRGYLITTQTQYFPTNQQVAFLQSTNGPDTSAVNLGTLGGGNSVAAALNNSNQVVGWSQIASGAQHAFLYMNGTMQDLNLMIPASSGITLTDAVGIDAAGRIVAYGTDAAGQTEEYLLTPQVVPAPEPSTLVVFGVAILAVAATRHRSRRNVSR